MPRQISATVGQNYVVEAPPHPPELTHPIEWAVGQGRYRPPLGRWPCQPMSSDTGIMHAAALSGQIHPSARTKASKVTVQIISVT